MCAASAAPELTCSEQLHPIEEDSDTLHQEGNDKERNTITGRRRLILTTDEDELVQQLLHGGAGHLTEITLFGTPCIKIDNERVPITSRLLMRIGTGAGPSEIVLSTSVLKHPQGLNDILSDERLLASATRSVHHIKSNHCDDANYVPRDGLGGRAHPHTFVDKRHVICRDENLNRS